MDGGKTGSLPGLTLYYCDRWQVWSPVWLLCCCVAVLRCCCAAVLLYCYCRTVLSAAVSCATIELVHSPPCRYDNHPSGGGSQGGQLGASGFYTRQGTMFEHCVHMVRLVRNIHNRNMLAQEIATFRGDIWSAHSVNSDLHVLQVTCEM